MKYGILSYSKSNNLGDQIQSIAASQFLPQIDKYYDRDFLNVYESNEDCKIIMNGWFMAKPENWPPADFFSPLFISFHITQDHQSFEKLLLPESIAYLKKYEPIGCRDHYTKELLAARGVNTFYSGCLTMTLQNKYQTLPKTNEIIFMDVLYKTQKKSIDFKGKLKKRWLFKQLFPKKILQDAIFLTQDAPKGLSEDHKIEMAHELLERYARAKMVITSRIHCALPCLALGTPVLFIDGDLQHATDTTRFKGITDYLNVFNASELIKNYPGALKGLNTSSFSNPSAYNWSEPKANPKLHLEIVANLKQRCENFISPKIST